MRLGLVLLIGAMNIVFLTTVFAQPYRGAGGVQQQKVQLEDKVIEQSQKIARRLQNKAHQIPVPKLKVLKQQLGEVLSTLSPQQSGIGRQGPGAGRGGFGQSYISVSGKKVLLAMVSQVNYFDQEDVLVKAINMIQVPELLRVKRMCKESVSCLIDGIERVAEHLTQIQLSLAKDIIAQSCDNSVSCMKNGIRATASAELISVSQSCDRMSYFDQDECLLEVLQY